MALTARQRRLYKDLIEIYKPNATTIVDKTPKDTRLPSTATYEDVPAKLFSKPEASRPEKHIGRSNMDIIFTLDELHVEASVDIDDTYYFRLKTPDHPDFNEWWVCQGSAKTRISEGRRKANVKIILCKKVIKPKGVVV